MANFKEGDRVVVVKRNQFSSLDENHFIGEAGEVVGFANFGNIVVIKFDNHDLQGLWECDIPGAEPIYRRFNVNCIEPEPEPTYEDFFDQLANILSL